MSNVLKLAFLILHCSLYGKAATECALYEKPGPLNCLKGVEVTERLTNSDSCWVVEFYSNWCGHCQHFAPTWKEIAYDVKGWKPFIQLGVVNCADSKNSDVCRKYKIMAYPTIKLFSPRLGDPVSNGGQEFRGSRSPKSIKKQFVDFIFKQSFRLPSIQELKLRDFLELKKTTSSLAILFEPENGDYTRMLTLDLASVPHDPHMTIYTVSSSEQVLANHLSVSVLPSLVLISSQETHVYNKESMQTGELRKGFLEAIQLWLNKAAPHNDQVTTLLPSNQQLQHSDVTVKEPIQLKQKDKTSSIITTLPSKAHLSDLQSTIAYTFRHEVSLHSIVSGAAFNALFQFCQLLEQVFDVLDHSTSRILGTINFQLRSRKQAGFMLSRDWLKLLDPKLDSSMAVLPTEPHWVSCAGSESKYRGYPCGLWMLLHTVTIHCFPLIHHSKQNVVRPQYRPWSIDSVQALRIARDYVVNFFTCEHCREHFTRMSVGLEASVNDDVSAILWLWRAHNSVNKRLASDISTDPAHPKVQFPNQQLCQACSISLNNNTLKWNLTAVMFYLFDFYSMGRINAYDTKTRTNIQSQLLSMHQSSSVDKQHALNPSSPFNFTDISLCLLLYIMITVMLLMFFLHLYYKRRRRKPAKFVV